MAEANQTPDVSKQLADLTSVVSTLAQGQKALLDSMAAQHQQTAQQSAAQQPGEKSMTAAEVEKVINDRLAAQSAAAQADSQRQQYINTKLTGLPSVYQNQLGKDPAKWATEEQSIRETYRKDQEAAGYKPVNVGGGEPGGVKPSATIDTSKMNPLEKISLGLKGQPTPDRVVVTNPAGQATGTAPAAEANQAGGESATK